MTPRNGRGRRGGAAAGGFTLIEVLVALVIVALGMSALLETLSASASNIGALRDKTVAEWIAMNEIANARLALSRPPIGITSGDVHNCGDADWHWQRQIAAVDAVPGLYSITVSVRRARPGSGSDSAGASSTGNNSDSNPPGSSSLGAPTLGAGSAIGITGCIDTISPGESLGSGSLGAGVSGSPGANGSLGASGTLGPTDTLGSGNSTALGAAGAATATAGQGAGAAGTAGASGAGNAGTIGSLLGAGASAGSGQSWLITLTGFRGNSLGAASGESPDWTGSTFAGEGGPNGIPNGGTTTGNLPSPAAPSQITAP
jgi:type II secretion system protein I